MSRMFFLRISMSFPDERRVTFLTIRSDSEIFGRIILSLLISAVIQSICSAMPLNFGSLEYATLSFRLTSRKLSVKMLRLKFFNGTKTRLSDVNIFSRPRMLLRILFLNMLMRLLSEYCTLRSSSKNLSCWLPAMMSYICSVCPEMTLASL